jgi:hypothetical protein
MPGAVDLMMRVYAAIEHRRSMSPKCCASWRAK